MVENMKENLKMIKKMGMGNLLLWMEKNTKENGKMENRMEKEKYIFLKIIFGKKVFGLMEKELNGLIMVISSILNSFLKL